MYVVDVIPFAPGAPAGALSYRSRSDLPLGSLVTVTLRHRQVQGIVVGSMPALEAKATLKTADFAVTGTISRPQGAMPSNLLEALGRTASLHAAPMGSVLSQLLGPWMDQGTPDFCAQAGGGFGIDPVECSLQERKTRYRVRIDENSARGRSTLMVVPTLAEVEYWRRALADLAPLLLTGKAKGKRESALTAAREATSLVICTPHFSFAQIKALDTIIIERVGAGGFRLPQRPYLDTRLALIELARARDLRLMYGDFPLPLEYRSGSRKLKIPRDIEVIDARKEREEGESWRAIPTALLRRIRAELDGGGRVAVLAARKAYAPMVVCRDCGQALRDPRGKAYAFSVEGGTRIFRTADGGSELSTSINCPHCGSWNLLPLGVGVERVYEELREEFAGNPVILFDADSVRTYAGARRKLSEAAHLGAIIVGTEAAVPWLLTALPVPLSFATIASADSLLALPFWRARERFLRLGYLLRALAPVAVVATRLPDDTAVTALEDPSPFFEEESALRRALGYPPFGTLISVSWEGSERALEKTGREVEQALAGYSYRRIPDRHIRSGRMRRTVVLSLPKDVWPETGLSRRLASFPPSVRVMLDPESFW